jgi:hypothetical protein
LDRNRQTVEGKTILIPTLQHAVLKRRHKNHSKAYFSWRHKQ